MQRFSPQKLSISPGPPKLGLTQTGVTDLPLHPHQPIPVPPKILSLKTSQLTIPHHPLSLSLSLTCSLSPSLALSSPSAQSINLSSAPAPLALCPICRCLWKHPRSPQPLRTPRLVQEQELLTKAQCGNEGCVEGGRGVLKGAALRQMAGEVSQLLHRGCQFKFTTTKETHGSRTSKEMPTKWNTAATVHFLQDRQFYQDVRHSRLI